MSESVGAVIYEGRFGASPREIRQILQRAAQSYKHKTLTPMSIFDELGRMIKDRTIYEFLQFEPRGKYHDAAYFLGLIKDEFADLFEEEVIRSMSLVAEEEYEKLLTRYVEHVVANIRKERIFNPATEQYEPASEHLMNDIEKIIGVQSSPEKHREGLLGRIAAYKLDHPKDSIDVTVIFQDILKKIQDHYYGQRKAKLQANFEAMLALDTGEESNLTSEERDVAQLTYAELERRFGYDVVSARDSLKFMLTHNKNRKK